MNLVGTIQKEWCGSERHHQVAARAQGRSGFLRGVLIEVLRTQCKEDGKNENKIPDQ